MCCVDWDGGCFVFGGLLWGEWWCGFGSVVVVCVVVGVVLVEVWDEFVEVWELWG